MGILFHITLFCISVLMVWTLSGFLVRAVDRVAKRYRKPGFAVAFFVLGFLTSIGEMSIAFNSSLEGVPQVSAGNLVGASIVIFLLIIPLLAILSGQVKLEHTISRSNLAFALFVIALPSLVAANGTMSPTKGLLLLAVYTTLVVRLYKRHPVEEQVEDVLEEVTQELTHKRRATIIDILYIVIGATLIFFGGNILVEESVYFTGLIGVPASIAGLLVLSVGTNIPEIIIGIQSVRKKHSDIAFGDYLGSAVANTTLFALLGILNPRFTLERSEFILSASILIPGLLLFFIFARSKNELSRKEGAVMFTFYIGFLLLQIINQV
jgi:cation:H+ antiporter